MTVCFHNLEKCSFCFNRDGSRPPIRRVKPRCPACGRFNKFFCECARCVARGFHALRLFKVAA